MFKKRRNMNKYMLLLWMLVADPVLASDVSGKVCFGKNLAKPLSEHTDRLYIRIDDSEKLFFNRPHTGPVLNNLDLTTDHIAKVYFDDQLAQSWKFNFEKLNAQTVVIWRAAGSWRMEPVVGARCK
jgi:hypothetical protein